MLKYAKIIDQKNGLCEVGIGKPSAIYKTVIDENGNEKTLYVSDFYKSLGMEEMDVEQAYNGGWYLAGKAPVKTVTKAELTAFVSAEADKIAYGGFTIISNGQEYLFKTTTDNITRCNSVLAMYEVLPDDTVIPWEVWQGDTPAMLPVNKTQFKQCFAFGANMIISVETVKGTLNAEIQSFTDEQLADSDNIAEFKARATATLEAVPRVYDMTETVTESDSGDSDGENTDIPNKETETE